MAFITVRDDISIAAGADEVWQRLADIGNWGRWTRIARHAAIYGPIRPGTEFKFDTGKWDFSGAIKEADPGRSLAVKARTIGIALDSRWEFDSSDSKTIVTVTLNATGWLVPFFRSRIENGLKDSLFTWLYALKVSTERGSERTEEARSRVELKRQPRKPFSLPGLNIFFKGQRKDRDDA